MARSAFIAFGVLAYCVFFATFLYLVGFVADLSVLPKTIDSGGAATLSTAVVVDIALIAAFGLQHSVMARQGFKRVWTRAVPEPIERSVYVLAASLMLILLFAAWQPIPKDIWHVQNSLGAAALWVIFAAGWLIVLLSTFLLNHFELFGLQQVYLHARGRRAAPAQMRQPLFYKVVRHPLYSGFFIAFWATPRMTAGHLLLAAGLSAYMLAAIRLEERDLVGLFGHQYEGYRSEVGMLTPRLGRKLR